MCISAGRGEEDVREDSQDRGMLDSRAAQCRTAVQYREITFIDVASHGLPIVGHSKGSPGPLWRQLRPAITPPSTLRIAPVIQLASGERRKTMELATSWAVPTRPNGWKLSNPFTVSSSWSAGMKRSYKGVATTAGATALTRMPSAASSIAKLWVRACRPAFAIE